MNIAPLIVQLLLVCSMVIFRLPARAQTFDTAKTDNVVFASIGVSTEVTTLLIFPAPITDGAIDRGHPDLATSTIPGVKNVLRVKAKNLLLPNTTLAVFTTDGKIYFFKVHAEQYPSQTVYPFSGASAAGNALYDDSRLSDGQIAEASKVLVAAPGHRHNPSSRRKGGMKARVTGVFQKQGVLFFKLKVDNRSAIEYPVNFLQCYIRDRTTAKRTAIMEKAVDPLHIDYAPLPAVPAGASIHVVIAVDQFTIADNKFFIIELFEKNGDRPLAIKIRGTDMLRARQF